MDTLQRIRKEFGSCTLKELERAANEAGVNYWTLIRAARGPNPNPRYKLIAAMEAYFAQREANSAPERASCQ